MKINMVRWAVIGDTCPYSAPEIRSRHLQGIVYNHPDHRDGTLVTTSRIISFNVETREVLTENGRTYVLGEPRKEYMDWCEKNGVELLRS